MTGTLKRKSSGLFLLFMLAGCVPSVDRAPTTTGTSAPPPRSFSTIGLESVMGRDAEALVRQFGQADLDVREGTARKLQFGSPVCVMDAYLYPRGRGEAVVTYIDTRLPDGRDVDRASCVAALSRRVEAR